jgi:hypothetical protein
MADHTDVSTLQGAPDSEHDLTCAGTDKRGVIVYVYSVNGNEEELLAYENGQLGKYFC